MRSIGKCSLEALHGIHLSPQLIHTALELAGEA
jgi:hypothetical protein